jgi:hypothetical protein
MPNPHSGSRIRPTTSLRERPPSLPNDEERWFDRALDGEHRNCDLAVPRRRLSRAPWRRPRRSADLRQ